MRPGVDDADQLTEQIILRWYAALRKNGNSNRTINNKHITLFGFLKWAGVNAADHEANGSVKTLSAIA